MKISIDVSQFRLPETNQVFKQDSKESIDKKANSVFKNAGQKSENDSVFKNVSQKSGIINVFA